MKVLALLLTLMVMVTYTYAGDYGAVYSPVIKAVYPSYAVHSPIIAAPGYGEPLVKSISVPVLTKVIVPAAPIVKTVSYGPVYGPVHYPSDYSYGPWH